ncbi:MAG: hypothetical protein K8R39_05350 [Arcobacteraceae bacterium]|nr:hypothetical protein [Arcobacteraceae bacterium]
MTRQPPHEDWVVYLVVLSVVAAMMLGKYLIGKGEQPIQDVIKEDIDELEHIIEDIEEKIK